MIDLTHRFCPNAGHGGVKFRQLTGTLSEGTRSVEVAEQGVSTTADQASHCDLVHANFLRWAKTTPDLAAVVSERRSFTYAELERVSRTVALTLLENGVDPGDVVIIESERSALLVIFLLAAMRIGAVFLVLGEDYPPEYTKKVLAPLDSLHWLSSRLNSDNRNLVEQMAGAKLASYLNIRDSALDRIRAGNGGGIRHDDQLAELSNDPDKVMYLASTSGSTGLPKLVEGTHRPVKHFIDWYLKKFKVDRGDRVSFLSGLGYDPMLRDVFVALSSGGSLWIPSASDLQYRHGIARWLAGAQVSIVHSTAALARLIFNDEPGVTLESLRIVAVGGAVLLRDLAARIRELAPATKVVNFYGATETPQAVAFHEVSEADLDNECDDGTVEQAIPLGRAVDGFKLLLVDQHGNSCGPGECGEICVVSRYLSRGYLGDPNATERVFVRSAASDGELMYRTGDLGRYNARMDLVFAGRRDRQVKCHGYRIQPEEIEATIGRCELVRHAVVVAKSSPGADFRLLCYVEPAQRDADVIEKIKKYVLNELPTYMLPEEFIRVAKMPMTHTGKIDAIALSAIDLKQGIRLTAARQELSKVQQTVLELWASVLDTAPEELTIDSNFFDVGGDSLSARRLVSELKSTFSKELKITDVFLYPKIRDLASHLSAEQKASDDMEVSEDKSMNRRKQIAAIRAKRMRMYS